MLFALSAISILLFQSSSQEKLDLNTILMNSVYKIEGRSIDDPNKIIRGTGFIIGKKIENDTSGLSLFVLVTAKHVFEDIDGESAFLKLRIQNSDTSYQEFLYEFPIRIGTKRIWFEDDDPNIDIAAVPIPLPEDFIKYFEKYFLSEEMLASDSLMNLFSLHPGDEVFSIGFPLGIGSNYFGFPILRSGKIASYPILPTSIYKSMLIDLNVFEGNSGSPVYIYENLRFFEDFGPLRNVGVILGVLTTSIKHISFREYENLSIEEKTPLGLGGVVPSSYLLKLLKKVNVDIFEN